MKTRKKLEWTNYLFILPIFLLFAVFIVYPIVYNFIVSFHEWSGIGADKIFVGFQNYVTIFSSKIIYKILKNFVIFAIVTITIQAALGMVFASFFINRLPGSSFYRILFYLPAVVTSTIIGQVFSKFFEANRGYLNTMLRSIGLDALCRTWLADPKLALGCLCFVNIWQWIGYSMLLYYAGMLNIGSDIYEAAEIDGANRAQSLFYITIPSLKPVLLTTIVLDTVWWFKHYTTVWLLTQGGPGNRTSVISISVYKEAFNYFNFGKAAAMSVIIFSVCFVISFVYRRVFDND